MNRKTVARKLLFLGEAAEREHGLWLEEFSKRPDGQKIQALQFDEMETFERSKCLPLSLPLAVCEKSRKVLAFEVASMPAKGPLAELSRRKYGRRKNGRTQAGLSVLKRIQPILSQEARITTDLCPLYPQWIRAVEAQSGLKLRHQTIKGARGSLTGQGELKKIGHDPLFSLNHTAAMFRANVNRLLRRTWCTTKRADRLRAHLWIYVRYHNEVLTQPRECSRP